VIVCCSVEPARNYQSFADVAWDRFSLLFQP
jgi:hypothetical protein